MLSEYDPEGRLTAVLDAQGRRIHFSHDVAARAEVITDVRGNVVRMLYDDRRHSDDKVVISSTMWRSIAIGAHMEVAVRTVQMTLDAELVAAVDRAARKMGTTRSAFTREALRAALRRVHEKSLEDRHREGYRRRPVRKGEFSDWEKEQAWIE